MISIAPVYRPDRSEARRLLASLGKRYPGGLDWLDRRLDDVEAGRAQAWRVGWGKRAVGYAILTPKGRHRVKLSTLYVTPVARRRGIGRRLLSRLTCDWLSGNLVDAFVTVDEADRATGAFFLENGFALLPTARRAYGSRFDTIYTFSFEAAGATGRLCPAAAHPS